MDKLEILSVQGDSVNEERQSFVVNTAANFVYLANIGVNDLRAARHGAAPNSLGYEWFQPDDNVRFLGMGIALPYQFTIGDRGFYSVIRWVDEDGANGVVSQVGNNGVFHIPFENFEFPFDVYVPHPSPGKYVKYQFFTFYIASDEAQRVEISMFNCPAALNEEQLHIMPWARIAHNLDILESHP